MELYDKIIAIYPELNNTPEVFSNGTIVLMNNSDGTPSYISIWEHKTLEKPTDEQLAALD
jgi:hypothetical protein